MLRSLVNGVLSSRTGGTRRGGGLGAGTTGGYGGGTGGYGGGSRGGGAGMAMSMASRFLRRR